jgi:NAD(P)-dependent dehydrogenase (short-subunit alcohol dehydrogenase family)
MSEAQEVVIITGANGALGSALVEAFASGGARVIAVLRGAAGEAALQRMSPNVLQVRANTSDPEALREALERAQAEVGPATGAVLTAGAWRGGHDFVSREAALDYRAVLDANLESANVALRAIVPGMATRGSGSVVLIGSRSGVRPYGAKGDAAYAAAKAALVALAQAIAAEVLSVGVRVNVVLPSTIDTDANRRAMPDADFSQWVTSASLAGVVAFLLSSGARDISGAALPVYGRVNV